MNMTILVGKDKTELIIDPEDDGVWGDGYLCNTGHGYIIVKRYLGGRKYSNEYLHRLITKAKIGEYVDHINGNKLDNRKSNLRLCSNSQNIINSGKKATNKSGYKGVHFNVRAHKWVAQITKDYKVRHLGTFETSLEAAEAYNKAAKQLHGDYAYLNTLN